jgi:regulator of RNase E activity RraA
MDTPGARLSEEDHILEQLRHCSVATVTHWLDQRGYRNAFMAGLQCVRPDLRMVGRARTMRVVPFRPDLAELYPDRDENPHRKAVDNIGAGEVLVIDAHGNPDGGILGDIMTARLAARGAAGLVVDGSLRDVWQIKELTLPVYVHHIHAAAIRRAGAAVEMDGVVTCAGVAVRPGDYVLGDPDGAVVIPAALAAEAAAFASEHDAMEEYIRAQVLAGAPLAEAYPPTAAFRAEYDRQRHQDA